MTIVERVCNLVLLGKDYLYYYHLDISSKGRSFAPDLQRLHIAFSMVLLVDLFGFI